MQLLSTMDIRPVVVAVLSFIIIFSTSRVHAATFTFTSNCPYTVWPVIQTMAGRAPEPQYSSTGFELLSSASQALNIVSAPWSASVWARTGCTTNASEQFICITADCGSGKVQCDGAGAAPPATFVDFLLSELGGQETQEMAYSVSLVDGFNLPIRVSPQTGGCQSAGCLSNLNFVCPPGLAVKGADGRVIACKSACLAFNQPQYCCTADYGDPEKCPPTNYSKTFKNVCNQAYTYPLDEENTTYTCPGGVNYLIEFCP